MLLTRDRCNPQISQTESDIDLLDLRRRYTVRFARRHIACSLASVRVTSSVCQPVQGSRLDVTVRWHSYGDISSITTYRVAARFKGAATRYDSPARSLRLPCTWANHSVWYVARMSRTRENRVKRHYSSFYFEPILLHEMCDYPIRAQQTPKNDLHLIRLRTRDG